MSYLYDKKCVLSGVLLGVYQCLGLAPKFWEIPIKYIFKFFPKFFFLFPNVWLISTSKQSALSYSRLFAGWNTKHNETNLTTLQFTCPQDAVAKILGKKPYFLGTKPTTIDCLLFGHLVQFLYIPMDFPQKAYMRENCKNLVDYVDRIKCEFWPDWDEECQKSCMIGKMGRVA